MREVLLNELGRVVGTCDFGSSFHGVEPCCNMSDRNILASVKNECLQCRGVKLGLRPCGGINVTKAACLII